MHISKIDENMDRAHKVDAITEQKFWFRTNILPTGKCYKYNIMEETDFTRSNHFANGHNGQPNAHGCCFHEEEKYHELYLYEIFEGKIDESQGIKYKGIFPLIREYMDDRKYDEDEV